MAHMLQVFTCIYLHATHKFEPKVGKYSSPMEHVGYVQLYMGVSKNSGTPKMDALFHGNPKKWMIWGGKPTIFGNIHITISTWYFFFHRGPTPRSSFAFPRHPVAPRLAMYCRCCSEEPRPRGEGNGEGESAAKDTIPMFDPKRYILGIYLRGMNHGIIDDMIPSKIGGKRHIPTIFGQKERACWCVVLIPMQGGTLLVRSGVKPYYNFHKSPYE